MKLKHIKLRAEHTQLLNQARLKFANKHPNTRTTDELTIITALQTYINED